LKYFEAKEKSVMVSAVGKMIDVATKKTMVPKSFNPKYTTDHFDFCQALQKILHRVSCSSDLFAMKIANF